MIKRDIDAELAIDGWEKTDAGRSAGIDYNTRYDLYIRRRKLADVIRDDEFSKISPSGTIGENMEKSSKINGLPGPADMVSNPSMGSPYPNMTPSESKYVSNGKMLPVLSGFDEFQSLSEIRDGKPAIVIAFDSEWSYMGLERYMLSWQFATISGDDLIEIVYLRKTPKDILSLETALSWILGYLGQDNHNIKSVDVRTTGIRTYDAITGIDDVSGKPIIGHYKTRDEAICNSIDNYSDEKVIVTRHDWSGTNHIPVVLLCHAGLVDVTSLDQDGARKKNVLRYCSSVQGGLVSMYPIKIYPKSLDRKQAANRHTRYYPVSLRISDTMCHAPAKSKSLKALGKAVGWEKVELDSETKSHMDILLNIDPRTYMYYASNDSVVTLLYGSALYGYNRQLPVTITSGTAKVMKNTMMKYLGCSNTKEFNRIYRGIKSVSHGLSKVKSGLVANTSEEAISDKANTVQHYASQAYHGGYNSCSDVGYYPKETYDYDIKNAYPTAMCLVADVDWENPISSEIVNRELTLQDFIIPMVGGYAPLSMMVAYVRFEFPENVKYPCIPVDVDGIPIFPRTSDGIDGVYVCGPELFLALRLGARVWVERGYFLNTLFDKNSGQVSYSLQSAVKQMVTDRNKAKAVFGKGSLEELILKTMVNSGYGKNAQNVIRKNTWSAYSNEMENIGCSSITNPVSACMITSIVRATLLAIQNQCHQAGYKTYSVTTDGFISDAPQDYINSCDLYGIRKFMEASRLFLTDGADKEIWEIKHAQDDLLNYTTRGNVSLHCDKATEHSSIVNPYMLNGRAFAGVCAHNSCKSGYDPDSYEDRKWLMEAVVSRTGTVDYIDSEWTTFKEVINGDSFSVKKVVRHIRMDYDMKRKPVKESFYEQTVVIDNRTYDIANFSTEPFETVEEYRRYRKKKELVPCLKTIYDWKKYWEKLDARTNNAKVRNMEWSILNSCIMGHRAGLWNIPELDILTGSERNVWINSHNSSGQLWKENDWKNAGRKARQANILPRDMLEAKLLELGAVG